MKHIVYFFMSCFLCIPYYLISTTVNLIDEKEFIEVINSSHPVVVKFFANWCGVCDSIKKPFEEISQDPEFSNITFICVDIDRYENLSQKYDVIGVPTFLFFNKGKKKGGETGIHGLDHFKQDFKQTIQSTFSLPKKTISSIPDDLNSTHNTESIFEKIKKALYSLWDFINQFFRNLWTTSQ